MLLNALSFSAGGHCTLTLDQPAGWLHATWAGYVTPAEAVRGAENYLAQAKPFHNPYLLNDNSKMRGPWFDSLEWLERVWLPQATGLGLRYIAHVVQADTHADILTLAYPALTTEALDIQLFDDLASAREWLRACQLPPVGQQRHSRR